MPVESPPLTHEIDRLLTIMARLRDPDTGCPWDAVQTFQTIAPYTIEEAYEVADAIERNALDELRGELGDLLFQVVFHARMAQEAGQFDFHDVARAISDKMEARHPHVFGDVEVVDAEAQTAAWEARKAEERAQAGNVSALDGVPLPLPALTRAEKIGKRAARVGFDWPDPAGIIEKIREETDEVDAELPGGPPEHIEEEIGDLLFTVAQLARKTGVDPELALRRANNKVETRFRRMEQDMASEGIELADADMSELEARWQAAKESLKDEQSKEKSQ